MTIIIIIIYLHSLSTKSSTSDAIQFLQLIQTSDLFTKLITVAMTRVGCF